MIDFDKLAAYSAAVPRYTSYPTAPEFLDNFSGDDLIRKIEDSNKTNRDISLYFHLPFCRSACYFCGCNVIYTSKEDLKDRYIDYLEKELEICSRHLNTKRIISQLHFGGGTPTFFSAVQLQRVIRSIKKTFLNISKNVEFGIEIDPRFFTPDHMKVFAENGVNRISFGVQDFDPKVQEAVHRIQPLDITEKAVEIARANGIKSINIDLMYGLPCQNIASFEETLRLTLELEPDRVALFNYAHVPWLKKTMRKIDETLLPAPSEKLRMLKAAIETFEGAGLEMIGMDHFAKPDDELNIALKEGRLHRNFQGYTTHGECDLFGFGVTSISEGKDFYLQNIRENGPYEAKIDQGRPPLMRGIELNKDDLLRKKVIMSLMSNFVLRFKEIEREFDIEFRTHFHDDLSALKPLEEDGLCAIDNEGITVGRTGRLLIRNIVMNFDAHLKKNQNRRFSKSI